MTKETRTTFKSGVASNLESGGSNTASEVRNELYDLADSAFFLDDDDASDIPYSNTASGLTATNVQGAIDEIVPTIKAVGILQIDSSGTTVFNQGMTCTRSATGTYDFTFSSTLSNTNYGVFVSFDDDGTNVQDYTAVVTPANKSTSGFRVTTHSEDNGGTADPKKNLGISVIVFSVV